MTYEDYMKLPKETLAKELARRDAVMNIPIPHFSWADESSYTPPCYAPDGICTNPHHDCINCPRMYSSGPSVTKANTTGL